MDKTIFYSLNEEDIQTVAMETIERLLNPAEISLIKEKSAEKINWFEAIESAIYENIENPDFEEDEE